MTDPETVENLEQTESKESPVYTVKTRKCISCDGTEMAPEKREFTGMETTLLYTCPNCDAKVEFKSLSQAGMMACLGLLVLGFITVIATNGPVYWDLVDYLLYIAVVLLFAFVPGSILIPYWAHPVTGEKKITETDLDFKSGSFADGFSDVMQRAIIRFERHGFWRGFLTPIVFIAVVLGIATAIGMVNYYVF